MDLAKISIKLRPRTPWESIDLGFTMARQWFLPLWLLWLCSAMPVMIVLTLLPLPLWLAGLLLWWFKPLYEPPLLYWLSRRLFAERTSVKAVFGSWLRIVLPQLFASLTWRRLIPSRSFVMPVVVLEGLKGKRRNSRIGVLGRRAHAAGWLTLVGLHFEVVLELGFIGLIVAVIPQELLWTDWQSYLFDPDPLSEWLHHTSALVAMSLIAPFYVAGGFALYLNRRSQLEAWDLELGLRQLAQRHQRRRLVSVASMLLVSLLVFGLQPKTSQALEINPTASQQLIQEVLAEEAFGRYEERGYWKYRGEDSDQDNGWLEEWLKQMLGGFHGNLAYLGEIVMWLAAGGVLAYLLYWFIHNRTLLQGHGIGQSDKKKVAPSHILGLDLRPESLPANPASEAARLIEQGDHRGGLSLLYRASLSVLVHVYSLQISEGATEGECLANAQGFVKDDLNDYFTQLTRVWQKLAYGHIQPKYELAVKLCQEWPGHFGVNSAG
ncbi:MAG: hypothetical protein KZQ82_07405 [Candidatus Thiodiazotropha sp. (ex Lucinoma annulata)]|nr:hypothetical protein [Candidatus Thiodiazotropha sp. (ex Lucinoma borealis)]MCU7884014.1 hypothetical protein [Candidatus Thiodiazotropha sp. (ex Lucinoma annulata)]